MIMCVYKLLITNISNRVSVIKAISGTITITVIVIFKIIEVIITMKWSDCKNDLSWNILITIEVIIDIKSMITNTVNVIFKISYYKWKKEILEMI